MIKYVGQLNDSLAAMAGCMSREERKMLGIDPSTKQDDVLRHGAAKYIAEDAIAASQQLVPLSASRSVPRKDLRPWQGKESDGEIMFNFESAMDAQDLYDFVLGTGLLTPGEVKLYMSEHQTSVHFAPSVLVQKPEIIQMALISYHEKATEESIEAMADLVEDVNAIMEKKAKSSRGSAEPKTNRVDFNPFHDKGGNFTSREGTRGGGSWSDGAHAGSKKLAASKKGKKLHFVATKLPCGRSARDVSKDIRCWDGRTVGGKLASVSKKSSRDSSDRLMPGVKEGFTRADLDIVNECRAMYGIKTRLSEGWMRGMQENEEEFIVIKKGSSGYMFWNGRGWSDEYADARKFASYKDAMKSAKGLKGIKVLTLDEYDNL